MKSRLTLFSLLALSIAFTSCKNEAEAEAAAVSTTPQQPLIVPRVQAIPTENYVQPTQQQVALQQPVQNVPQNIAAQAPVATKPGMNPPHGQPGHRCDIPVGASLSTPVAKPAAAPGKFTTTTIQTPTATAQSGVPDLLKADPSATPTAPGMNPPHGQEGHQCGIAVGAPLPKTDTQQ